jgi:hypothetical protein
MSASQLKASKYRSSTPVSESLTARPPERKVPVAGRSGALHLKRSKYVVLRPGSPPPPGLFLVVP